MLAKVSQATVIIEGQVHLQQFFVVSAGTLHEPIDDAPFGPAAQ
jgi:hypothetical protein